MTVSWEIAEKHMQAGGSANRRGWGNQFHTMEGRVLTLHSPGGVSRVRPITDFDRLGPWILLPEDQP